MKKQMASAGLLALGVVGVATAQTVSSPSSSSSTTSTSSGSSFLPSAGPSEKPWTVSGTLRGFYDDNYNDAPDGSVDRRSTFGFELQPGISLNLPANPQTTLTASYTFDLRYYQDRPSNKADYDHNFQLAATHAFNENYSMDVSDQFIVDQEPQLIDPTFGTVSRVDGSNIRDSFLADLNGQLTPLFGFKASYQLNWWDYSQTGPGSVSAVLDRVENTFTLNSTWQLAPETTGIIGYSLDAENHTSSDNLFGPPVPGSPDLLDSYTHSFYVGAIQNFSPELSAHANVGVSYTDYPNDSSSGSAWGPYVDSGASWIYMQGGVASLSFHVGRNETDQQGSSAADLTTDQLSEQIAASVTQQITPKLNGGLTGTFQSSTFRGGPSDGETDDIFALGLQFVYQFDQYFSAQAGYNYDRVESNIPGRPYDRNRVFLGVSASY
jgi:hypothetical protein